MDTLLTLLLGVALRLAVPALLTTLLVRWLRRLDARWQAEAERARAHEPVVVTPPCWETRQCSEAQRAQCPAYQHTGAPCWQIKRQRTGQLPEQCLDCTVFRNAPIPVPARSVAR